AVGVFDISAMSGEELVLRDGGDAPEELGIVRHQQFCAAGPIDELTEFVGVVEMPGRVIDIRKGGCQVAAHDIGCSRFVRRGDQCPDYLSSCFHNFLLSDAVADSSGRQEANSWSR